MGRSADTGESVAANTGGVTTKDPLLTEISALLGASEAGDDPERLERILTDGYARALALEGDYRRLERAGEHAGAQRAREELGLLRAELVLLRRRHSSAVRSGRALHQA
jgi:hypothetical protein